MYLNGGQVGTTGGTGYGFGGLACSASYTLGVAAYDAAGNVSGVSSIGASTAGCPPPPPSVSVGKGPGHTTSFCTSSLCAYVTASWSNFGAGNHTVTCNADYPGGSDPFLSYTVSGASGSSNYCIFGYHANVWVTVDGVRSSNTVGW